MPMLILLHQKSLKNPPEEYYDFTRLPLWFLQEVLAGCLNNSSPEEKG